MALKKDTGYGRYALEHAVLGLLMAEPKHGYGLYQDFVTHFDKIWSAGQTHFYLALAATETQGFAEAAGTERQQGKPPRKVYAITAAGRGAFLDWLHHPVNSMRAMRVELVGKLRFFDLLALPPVDFIHQQQDTLKSMMVEWSDEVQHPSTPQQFYPLVLDFRLRQAQAILDWLQSIEVETIQR